MYIPVFWQDRIVEHPRRVRVTDLGNGIKEWAPDPGEISQKGTQQSSTNFGNMDFGNVERTSGRLSGYECSPGAQLH